MAQFHYLDDSGDPGVGGSASSSSHYVLAMVELGERGPLLELVAVRQAFHLPPLFEFKYHKTTTRQKAAFFNASRGISFHVRAVVIDKGRLDAGFITMSGQELTIEFLSTLVFRAAEDSITNDVLIIDGGTPAFRQALRRKLSKEARTLERSRLFKKIVGSDSKRDDGLQLADMIAGAIRRHAMNIEDDFYQTFASKVIDLWEMPAKGI